MNGLLKFISDNVVLLFSVLIGIVAIMLFRKKNPVTGGINTSTDTPTQTSPDNGEVTFENASYLGYRQKNPLNIRPSGSGTGDKWQGVVGAYAPGSVPYLTFSSFAYGYRAAFRTLRTYHKRGLNTLAKIIPTWAPAKDNNDPSSYIAFVEKESGTPRNKVLNFDYQTYSKIVRAMSILESRVTPSESLLQKAWEMEKQ
jgi:hypothetical protein